MGDDAENRPAEETSGRSTDRATEHPRDAAAPRPPALPPTGPLHPDIEGAAPWRAVVVALLPVLLPAAGLGLAYVYLVSYLDNFGVPRWSIRPEFADLADLAVLVVLGAALASAARIVFSRGPARTAPAAARTAEPCTGPGREDAVGGSVDATARAASGAGIAASSPARILTATGIAVFLATLTANALGSCQAGRQDTFDVAGTNDEWVVLRRTGDQLLAVQRDTLIPRRLRLTGTSALLKATPDSEPVVVRRRVLVQDSLTSADVSGTRRAADTARILARLREHVDALLQATQQAQAVAGPSGADCPAGLGRTPRRVAPADSVIRLVGVERRRVTAWRLTYQVRRGPLRGDSIRVAVRDALTAVAALCRGDSLLASAWPAAAGDAELGAHGGARTTRPRPR